jgi:hypothetical protein
MKTLRAPRPIRGLRQAVPDRTEAPSRTAYQDDQPHIQMLDQFLPQIAAESEEAAKPARIPFFYYRRKRTGRRCSCFSTETSPDGYCQICFGSGFVGGWDMHGCRTELLESTLGNLRLVNVSVNYHVRPALIELNPGARNGFIEGEINLIRNVGTLQTFQLIFGNKRAGTTVSAQIKTPSDLVWVPFTKENIEARLSATTLAFQILFSRTNTSIPSPRFSHMMIRYQLIPEVRMYGDMNLAEESFELGELGFTDAFSQASIYVPHSFDHINNEDFLIRLSDMKRFKVTRYERNSVNEILLSHRVMARLLIPGTDSLITFP